MNTVYIVIGLLGLPLDWLLKVTGYPDALKPQDGKKLEKAMARSFRCGLITLVVLVLLSLIFLP
jgi:hypothetical protein